MPRLLAVLLTAGAVVWAAAVAASAAAHGTGWSALVHDLASAVCHQRPERSFAVEGHPFPVCARCTGLYVSGSLGALAAWFGPGRVVRRSRDVVLLAALPTAATIPVEWLGLSPLSNAIRAAAALPLGAAAGWVFVRLLRSEERARRDAL